MADELVNATTQVGSPEDRRIYGVAVAQVVENCDDSGQGRVKVRFPWLPGYEPWARVASLMAGTERGTYFMPQAEEEVLVAFNHGDVRAPYIVGSLWNGRDKAPAKEHDDPVNLRIIRTPAGHEIVFDDASKSISIRSSTGQEITIDENKIRIATKEKKEAKEEQASVTLGTDGRLTLTAKESIKLDAPSIRIHGQYLTIKAEPGTKPGSSIEIDGGEFCNIHATAVAINS
jgi:uncharacterized protein involved in type VI secretion and phage assembly